MQLITLAGLALVPVVLLDALWLGVITRGLYKARLGHLLSGNIVWWAAILFYVLFSIGIAVFALMPALESRSLLHALLLGALLGAVAYGTYDLTNHATMREWPLSVTLLDIAWGTFIAAASSGIAYYVATTFLGK